MPNFLKDRGASGDWLALRKGVGSRRQTRERKLFELKGLRLGERP